MDVLDNDPVDAGMGKQSAAYADLGGDAKHNNGEAFDQVALDQLADQAAGSGIEGMADILRQAGDSARLRTAEVALALAKEILRPSDTKDEAGSLILSAVSGQHGEPDYEATATAVYALMGVTRPDIQTDQPDEGGPVHSWRSRTKIGGIGIVENHYVRGAGHWYINLYRLPRGQ